MTKQILGKTLASECATLTRKVNKPEVLTANPVIRVTWWKNERLPVFEVTWPVKWS